MNQDAFGIRVRLLQTIASRPQASVLPHGRAANLDFHKWCRPGGPPCPALAESPFCCDLSPGRQFEFVPSRWLGLHPGRIGLVSCREHGWTTHCLLWGETRTESTRLVAGRRADCLRFQPPNGTKGDFRMAANPPCQTRLKSMNPR